MTGTITKRHFFQVAKSFGWKKACTLLFSKEPVALIVLMS